MNKTSQELGGERQNLAEAQSFGDAAKKVMCCEGTQLQRREP